MKLLWFFFFFQNFFFSFSHGTRCAAIAAGVANNGICGVGVAYEARVGGKRIFHQGQTHKFQKEKIRKGKYEDIFSQPDRPQNKDKCGHQNVFITKSQVQIFWLPFCYIIIIVCYNCYNRARRKLQTYFCGSRKKKRLSMAAIVRHEKYFQIQK